MTYLLGRKAPSYRLRKSAIWDAFPWLGPALDDSWATPSDAPPPSHPSPPVVNVHEERERGGRD